MEILNAEEIMTLKGISSRELMRELMMRKITLEDLPTWMLCDELEKRRGVQVFDLAPEQKMTLDVEGVAVVYIVTD